MYARHWDAVTGTDLPARTLCLTFDDGPAETPGIGVGPHTLKLAEYLSDQKIPATFFMVGKHAEQSPTLLPQIQRLGHLIGNHTYSHPALDRYVDGGGDPVQLILRADHLIKPYVDSPFIFFRPPYGSWREDIAQTLNGHLETALAHAGPINWNIDGTDWSFWMNNQTPEDCVARYLQTIAANGNRGIVLMHDCTADMDVVMRANQTCAMVQLLVPALMEQGYNFVRVDEIPAALALAQVPMQIALLASNGMYVSPQGGGGGEILVNGHDVGPWEHLVVEYVAPGTVALRASNGLYISPQNGGAGAVDGAGEVLANGPCIGPCEPLDLISVGSNKVAFRTAAGNFISREAMDGGHLVAPARTLSGGMGDWELFTMVNLSA